MEEKVHPKYLKGFNHAYLLAQHKPQLIEQLLTTATENEYLNGIKDGKSAFEQEQSQNRLQELKNLNSHLNKDNALER